MKIKLMACCEIRIHDYDVELHTDEKPKIGGHRSGRN